MDKLIRVIEAVQSKLANLRKRSLKETPTRTIIVDPLLEALGWDVRDPDEVQLEYPTVDGKSVDYALLINQTPVLLVEAKALDDPLNDVKAITQVVGYAANDGVVWCVLTNGIIWKVYRSVEQCPAPDKLMFEVSLDPREGEGIPIEQNARQMWRFSRDEMAKGTLDAIGEKTFTDGKVRKAMDGIMRDAPRTLLNLVRSAAADEQLAPQQIKESLARIWAENLAATPSAVGDLSIRKGEEKEQTSRRSRGATRAWITRREKATTTSASYDESHHTSGKPQEVLALFRAIERICLSLKPGSVERRCKKMTVNYLCGKAIFCCVELQKGGIKVSLKLKHSRLEDPPSFARDVSSVGHYGVGDLQLAISNMAQLEEATPLIRKSLEGQLVSVH